MTLDLGNYAGTMARYNQWMNNSLYKATANLTQKQRRADCDLFFGSIHNTLNHLLVCDLMWLARFESAPVTVSSLTQELFGDFESLREAREQTDRDIIAWSLGLAASPPPGRLHYVSLSGNTGRDVDFVQAIIHFFNHQTHHRGQVTAALSRYGVDFGVTDLIFMPEE